MGNSSVFTIKVWLTVILLSPLLLNLLQRTFIFELYFFYISLGILFSFPALIIFLVIAYLINQKRWNIILKKLLLVFIGSGFIFLTFYPLEFDLKITYTYCTILLVAIILFKLEPMEEIKN